MWAMRFLAFFVGTGAVVVYHAIPNSKVAGDSRSQVRNVAVIAHPIPVRKIAAVASAPVDQSLVASSDDLTPRQELLGRIRQTDAEIFREAVRQLQLPVLPEHDGISAPWINPERRKQLDAERDAFGRSAKGLEVLVRHHGIDFRFEGRRSFKNFHLGNDVYTMGNEIGPFYLNVYISIPGTGKNLDTSMSETRMGTDLRTVFQMNTFWSCVDPKKQTISHILYREPFQKNEELAAWAYNLKTRTWIPIGQGQTWAEVDNSNQIREGGGSACEI